MSSVTPDSHGSLTQAPSALHDAVETGRSLTVTGVHAVAFWTAIVLPLPTLSLLHGGVSGQQIWLLVGLLIANALCLVIGHDYSPNNP